MAAFEHLLTRLERDPRQRSTATVSAAETEALLAQLTGRLDVTFRCKNNKTGESIVTFGAALVPTSYPVDTHPAPHAVFALPFFDDPTGAVRFTPEWVLYTPSRDCELAFIAHHRGQLMAPARPFGRVEIEGQRAFEQRVARAAAASRLGINKVVLARAERWQTAAISPNDVFERLCARNPSTVCFSLKLSEEQYFVGATPERLVALDDQQARSMALAGTARRGRSVSEDQRLGEALMRDPKERYEHALVVADIEHRLKPFTKTLSMPSRPELRRLARIQHLQTPISGQVSVGVTLEDLVGALHPTPAVCGTPHRLAQQWLRQTEPLARGLYCGPIGWMRPDGSGEASVALRCALLERQTVTAFAGIGVVSASQPAREWAETELKLDAMRRVFPELPQKGAVANV